LNDSLLFSWDTRLTVFVVLWNRLKTQLQQKPIQIFQKKWISSNLQQMAIVSSLWNIFLISRHNIPNGLWTFIHLMTQLCNSLIFDASFFNHHRVCISLFCLIFSNIFLNRNRNFSFDSFIIMSSSWRRIELEINFLGFFRKVCPYSACWLSNSKPRTVLFNHINAKLFEFFFWRTSLYLLHFTYDKYVSSEQTVEWRQWMCQPAGVAQVAQREGGRGSEGRRRRGEEKARGGDGEPKLMSFKDKRK
jgi:hypothetical protein